MSYCIYLRKSRSDDELESHFDGETLARHETALINLGQKLKLPITAVYKEVVSGETISARPVVQQLLTEVEKGYWEGVLVMEIERLARGDTIDQGIIAQTFKYSDTKIITPAKTYNPSNEFDEEYFEFGLFMSRREYKTINRRLNRGRIASVAEGKYIGSKPPFGYERIKLQKEKGYSLKIVEEEAFIVKLIFEYFTIGKLLDDNNLERLSCSNIAKELNKRGIKSTKNIQWSYSAIGALLRNPVYIGKIKWGARAQVKKVVDGEVIISRPRKKLEEITLNDGLHESIVSEEQFYQAQNILNQNMRHTTPAKYLDKNPLAGLIICANCGKKITRRSYGNGYPDTLLCQNSSCTNASSSLSLVETAILNALVVHFEDLRVSIEDSETSLKLQDTSNVKMLKYSKTELDKLQKQLESLYALLEQGIYSKELFIERKIKLTKDMAEINSSIKKLETEILGHYKKQKANNDTIPQFEHVLEQYNLLSIKQKRLLLESVVEKVLYKKRVGGRWRVDPDDFCIEIFPKM